MKYGKRILFALVVIGVALAIYIGGLVEGPDLPGVSVKPLTLEQAQARLAGMVERIQWSSRPVQRPSR